MGLTLIFLNFRVTHPENFNFCYTRLHSKVQANVHACVPAFRHLRQGRWQGRWHTDSVAQCQRWQHLTRRLCPSKSKRWQHPARRPRPAQCQCSSPVLLLSMSKKALVASAGWVRCVLRALALCTATSWQCSSCAWCFCTGYVVCRLAHRSTSVCPTVCCNLDLESTCACPCWPCLFHEAQRAHPSCSVQCLVHCLVCFCSGASMLCCSCFVQWSAFGMCGVGVMCCRSVQG